MKYINLLMAIWCTFSNKMAMTFKIVRSQQLQPLNQGCQIGHPRASRTSGTSSGRERPDLRLDAAFAG